MAYKYDPALLKKGLSYQEYLKAVEEQISKPAAEESEQKLLPYKKKNLELMTRLEKKVNISEALRQAIISAPKTKWLVITEGWCGDAAFIVPILAVAEKEMPQKVDLNLYFRDSNLDLMDANLTNGGRSIPKLIILDEHLDLLTTWGPRPEKLQQKMDLWKEQGMELKELIPKVAAWYEEDDTHAIQQELVTLFSQL